MMTPAESSVQSESPTPIAATPLDYAVSSEPRRAKPLWIGAPITIANVVSAFARVAYEFNRGRRIPEGKLIVFGIVMFVCVVCLFVGGMNLRRRVVAHGMTPGSVVSLLGIVSGIALIAWAVWANVEAYGL